MNTEWMEHAKCVGEPLDDFFPNSTGLKATKEAQKVIDRVCSQCPVKRECGEYGRGSLGGVWGGRLNRVKEAKGLGVAPLKPHGTEAAMTRHRRRGEKPCFACIQGAERANARRRGLS